MQEKINFLKKAYKNFINRVSDSEYRVFTGGFFGMNIYTPNSITSTERDTNDRPYAGWLYTGYLLQASDLSQKHNNSLEFQLGIVGSAAAQEYTQTYVHEEIVPSDTPLGWDNQIKNQFAVNLVYMYRYNYLPFKKTKSGEFIRLIPQAGFSLGNITNYINAGGIIAIGRSSDELPSLPIQPSFIIPGLTDPNDKQRKFKINPEDEAYIFAGIDYRYYASNLFIEGSGESSHNIELAPLVYDLLIGISFRKYDFCKCKLSYQFIRRSKEFYSNVESLEKPHNLGQINFEWYY